MYTTSWKLAAALKTNEHPLSQLFNYLYNRGLICMKTAKLVPGLLLMLAVVFYGCKKSSPAPKAPNLLTFDFQGKKDTIAAPYLVKVQVADLSISGSSLVGPAMDILIGNYKKGVNTAIGTDSFINFRTTDAGGTIYACRNGTLYIITQTQTHIRGSFAGTASKAGDNSDDDKIPVTGTFDVDIPQ